MNFFNWLSLMLFLVVFYWINDSMITDIAVSIGADIFCSETEFLLALHFGSVGRCLLVGSCCLNSAACCTIATWRGLMTVMSRAVSFPPVQAGMYRSAGLASVPGNRALSSLEGARHARVHVLKRASLIALCLKILSPPQARVRIEWIIDFLINSSEIRLDY